MRTEEAGVRPFMALHIIIWACHKTFSYDLSLLPNSRGTKSNDNLLRRQCIIDTSFYHFQIDGAGSLHQDTDQLAHRETICLYCNRVVDHVALGSCAASVRCGGALQ